MPVLCLDEYLRLKALLDAGLLERVAALEGQLAGATMPRQPEPLKERNSARVADGERLREAIAGILASHAGPLPISAKRVLRALERMDIGREELPSERTVRWHMQQIRGGNGNTTVLPSQ